MQYASQNPQPAAMASQGDDRARYSVRIRNIDVQWQTRCLPEGRGSFDFWQDRLQVLP